MNNSNKIKIIDGQSSFVLETKNMKASVTRRAGMIAPVMFYRNEVPVQPYSIAPWAEEPLVPGTPSIIACLRGDFICSAFGGNDEAFCGKQLPIHGETANETWELVSLETQENRAVLKMKMALKIQGGKCEAITALIEGHNIVYQRHDFSGINGAINPGHHATLRFPDKLGAGALSFSRHIYAHTFIEPVEKGYSFLKPNEPITDLTAVPCLDGTTTDITVFPARRGFEDIVIICADTALDLAWSAVVFPELGYVWFSLRNPKILSSTLLWISNGGRRYPPWNGRHVNIMGIEDITGFFHTGLASSSRENMLNRKGVATCHRLKPAETLHIPYIQGVARVPAGFDRVVSIKQKNDCAITLTACSGAAVSVPCNAGFVKTGKIEGIC